MILLVPVQLGACGLVDKAIYSRSEGLGFNSQCWPSVEVSGKLCIPYCLCPPSGIGYLVHRSKVGSIVAGCIGAHLARGKVKSVHSVENALSWSLDSNQLPLPLTYDRRTTHHKFEPTGIQTHDPQIMIVHFMSLRSLL